MWSKCGIEVKKHGLMVQKKCRSVNGGRKNPEGLKDEIKIVVERKETTCKDVLMEGVDCGTNIHGNK